MKKNKIISFGVIAIIFLMTSIFFLFLGSANAAVRVRGYVKKNGTYVAPSYRSNPNKSKLDNYSTKGNYNPYTGRLGSKKIKY